MIVVPNGQQVAFVAPATN